MAGNSKKRLRLSCEHGEGHGLSTADEGSRTKQQKTAGFIWYDGKVGYNDLPLFLGISLAGKFEGTHDEMSIEDIKNIIDDTSALTVPSHHLVCYKGFKAALKDILTDIENKSHEIILIHGVPQIGKTSLAMCLAYYLALEGDSAAYIKMACTPELDSEVAVSSLSQYFHRSKWVIFDQCNLDCIRETDFLQRVRHGRKNPLTGEDPKIPVIMFTSGHYAPQACWTNNDTIKFKVISIRVDEACVDNLKELNGIKDDVCSKDVLKISTIFGHINKCLQRCRWYLNHNEELSFETLQETVYQLLDFETLCRRSEFFWLLWPELAQAPPMEIAQIREPDLKLKPYQVQYLGLLLTGISDPQDRHVNDVINWLDISGNKEADKEKAANEAYCTFEASSYFYYFPHLEKLLSIMVKAFKECTPQKLYAAYLDVYKKVEEVRDLNAQSLRGMLFKNLVRLVCEIQVAKTQKGLCIHGGYADLSSVTDVNRIRDVDELCKKAVKLFEEDTPQTLWCILNVPGEVQFPGYDFAFISVGPDSKLIQLLQVTVNPLNHSKETMNSDLIKVKDKCKSYNAAVEGYFLVPMGAYHPAGSLGGVPVAVIDLQAP